MNKLQEKATELIAMGESYGLEPQITTASDFLVCVDYNQKLHTEISFTETGKVSVKSFQRLGRKTESVSLIALSDYLRFFGEEKRKRAGN
jgi:hypothetical protein